MKTIKYKGKTYKVFKAKKGERPCEKCSLGKTCMKYTDLGCSGLYWNEYLGAKIIGRIRWGKVVLYVIIAVIALIGLVVFVYSKMK